MTSIRTIAAIPTTYNGIEFRSRLEARWAIFFEGLDLRWDYEPEGFFLGEAGEYDPALMYLPDFLVLTPQGEEMWFEIKPITIKQDDKFDKFYQLLHKPKNKEEEEDPWRIKSVRAKLLSGQPKDVLKEYNICPRCGFFLDIKDTYSHYVYCMHCDCETPTGGGHELEKDSVFNIPCRPHKGDINPESFNDYIAFPSFYSSTRSLAEYCRSARF